MRPQDFIRAARVPNRLKPQTFGLWTIARLHAISDIHAALMECRSQTLLYRLTEGTLHQPPGDIVMEDSPQELRKHLPIWMAARGRVLVTGLGLGCVVRGLLASPEVGHVEVVEIDPDIIRVVGAEFAGDPRVTIHRGDARTIELPGTWNFAWHDLWCDGSGLHSMHLDLIARFGKRIGRQGAWAFPRMFKRFFPNYLG
jgi:hypothetical protein